MRSTHWSVVSLLVGLMAACTGPGESRVSDDLYGHRYGEDTTEGRLTVLIEPPETGVTDYEVALAPFDTVHVRPQNPSQNDAMVSVEALVKGAFPDGCTELHALEADRQGSTITAEILIRRQPTDVCTQAVRPYRFYFDLPGQYGSGEYDLVVNGRPFSFRVGS
jgi:hypothetical protein